MPILADFVAVLYLLCCLACCSFVSVCWLCCGINTLLRCYCLFVCIACCSSSMFLELMLFAILFCFAVRMLFCLFNCCFVAARFVGFFAANLLFLACSWCVFHSAEPFNWLACLLFLLAIIYCIACYIGTKLGCFVVCYRGAPLMLVVPSAITNVRLISSLPSSIVFPG